MKVVLFCVIVAGLLQLVELRRFRITTYCVTSPKVNAPCEILFLSDLHGKTYNGRLIKRLSKLSPDYILVGGDVVSKKKPNEMSTMPEFLKQLTEIAPVFYGFGNHETTIDKVISQESPACGKLWAEYLSHISQYGIRIERNTVQELRDDIVLCSLELPEHYFKKFKTTEATQEDILNLFPDLPKEEKRFQILMAHNPAFSEQYLCLSPNLILSGHTHGGLVRFPLVGSLISVELTWNPKYDGGRYRLLGNNGEDCTLIVSKGLGNHSLPIRILDRAEAVRILLKPDHTK
ncbi:MAG: metallophosphoesterase [Lachnospiraceae bacterium]